MGKPLALLHQRSSANWIGLDQTLLLELTHHRLQTLKAFSQPVVFLAETDPTPFLAGFLAACSIPSCRLFLCNPQWGSREWEQVEAIELPNVVWGGGNRESGVGIEIPDLASVRARREKDQSSTSKILIPTGGSSGKIRFAMHTWDTLSASVAGFRAYFEVDRVNSCCILPLYHVSGLMQFLRSFLSGGQFVLPQNLTAPSLNFNPADFFLSLVPTQLQRLIADPVGSDRLSQFCTVLLGGAPAWEDLLDRARQAHIQIAPTYGMTETASQVATLKPADFLQGRSGCGQVLPHAQVQIQDETGQAVGIGEVGIVAIQATSLAFGYYPDHFAESWFQTDDLGYFTADGNLQIVGRKSHKILTGGENVFPQEVEAAIRATGLVKDVNVMGLPDAEWGEVVTAAYVPIASMDSETLDLATLQAAIAPQLAPFKRPKHWIALEQLPRNAQGKVNRSQLEQIITKKISEKN
jgi:O-succinylbenzoic acid--CoA ligase